MNMLMTGRWFTIGFPVLHEQSRLGENAHLLDGKVRNMEQESMNDLASTEFNASNGQYAAMCELITNGITPILGLMIIKVFNYLPTRLPLNFSTTK